MDDNQLEKIRELASVVYGEQPFIPPDASDSEAQEIRQADQRERNDALGALVGIHPSFGLTDRPLNARFTFGTTAAGVDAAIDQYQEMQADLSKLSPVRAAITDRRLRELVRRIREQGA